MPVAAVNTDGMRECGRVLELDVRRVRKAETAWAEVTGEESNEGSAGETRICSPSLAITIRFLETAETGQFVVAMIWADPELVVATATLATLLLAAKLPALLLRVWCNTDFIWLSRVIA